MPHQSRSRHRHKDAHKIVCAIAMKDSSSGAWRRKEGAASGPLLVPSMRTKPISEQWQQLVERVHRGGRRSDTAQYTGDQAEQGADQATLVSADIEVDRVQVHQQPQHVQIDATQVQIENVAGILDTVATVFPVASVSVPSSFPMATSWSFSAANLVRANVPANVPPASSTAPVTGSIRVSTTVPAAFAGPAEKAVRAARDPARTVARTRSFGRISNLL